MAYKNIFSKNKYMLKTTNVSCIFYLILFILLYGLNGFNCFNSYWILFYYCNWQHITVICCSMHIKLLSSVLVPRVKESERTSVFFNPEDLFREIEIECVCETDLELSIKAA